MYFCRATKFLGKVGKVVISKEGETVHVQFPGSDSAYRMPTNYLKKVNNHKHLRQVLDKFKFIGH